MGKLVLWGAIGGIGKGITQMATERHELEKEEGRTAREIQLQRMRDTAARERQEAADTAAAERQEAEWGPGGYREVMRRVEGEITSEESS